MKWIYSIKNKAAAAAALFCLCVLVLLSNFNDRQHTKEVKNSIDMLFEDRLVAESYILTLTDCMHQIRETLSDDALGESEANQKISSLVATIDQTNLAYEKTNFTSAETKTYSEFKKLCGYISSAGMQSNSHKIQSAKEALVKLNALSAIQIEESKLIMDKSERLYDTKRHSSDFAMAIIIVIGLVLQALIFASKTLIKPGKAVDHSLN